MTVMNIENTTLHRIENTNFKKSHQYGTVPVEAVVVVVAPLPPLQPLPTTTITTTAIMAPTITSTTTKKSQHEKQMCTKNK